LKMAVGIKWAHTPADTHSKAVKRQQLNFFLLQYLLMGNWGAPPFS
jgi:hypothetical protein